MPVVPVEVALKGGVSEIPELVGRQVEALEFVLGSGFYEFGALREYLETLSKYPFFRFVVFLNPDQTLFGMIDARKLSAILQDPRSELSFDGFAMLVNSQAKDDWTKFASLPGFVPADASVTRQSDKREVLAKMEERGTDWLPVQTPEGRFEGIVDRSRLTASLILDVTNQLKALPPPQP